MPVLLLILLAGVFCYFLWRHTATSLTRNCRWRQEKARNRWRCAYCGATEAGDGTPRACRDPRRG